MADYEASPFLYRPGISQDSAQMHRHAGVVSAQQTQDDNAAMEAQKEFILNMLMGKMPASDIGKLSPFFPSDVEGTGIDTSPYAASTWKGNMR